MRSTLRRQAPRALLAVEEAREEAVDWEHANVFARYRCSSRAAVLNALTRTPIARLREIERWLETVTAMIEGLSLAKVMQLGGIRAASAFFSRPRSKPSRFERGTSAVLEACGDQAKPHWILGALHKFRFIPAILLTLNGNLALAVAPSHSMPSHSSPSPPSTSTSSPSPSPSPAAAAPAPTASAPGHVSAAPAPAPAGTTSAGHVFYLSSCGLIHPCAPGQSASAPLVAVPY
jgi:hypothetical protein